MDDSVDLGAGINTEYTLLIYLTGSGSPPVSKSKGKSARQGKDNSALTGGETTFYGMRLAKIHLLCTLHYSALISFVTHSKYRQLIERCACGTAPETEYFFRHNVCAQVQEVLQMFYEAICEPCTCMQQCQFLMQHLVLPACASVANTRARQKLGKPRRSICCCDAWHC